MNKAIILAFILLGISTMHAHADIVDLVGDMDNFGYGGDAPNPPQAFDNSGAGDLGIFDQAQTADFETFSWTHDFTSSPGFGTGFVATRVVVDIPEMFADNTSATIQFDDGIPFQFVDVENDVSGSVVNRQFVFDGPDAAAFANDGIVEITFNENLDDIALDFSQITVTGTTTGTNAVPEPSSCLMLSLVAGTAIARRRR